MGSSMMITNKDKIQYRQEKPNMLPAEKTHRVVHDGDNGQNECNGTGWRSESFQVVAGFGRIKMSASELVPGNLQVSATRYALKDLLWRKCR